MKYFFVAWIQLFVGMPLLSGQSQESWEEFGERIGRQAEQLAERISKQAERNAARLEANAQRLSRQLEQQWNQKWDRNKDRRYRSSGAKSRNQSLFCPEGAFLGIEANDLSREKAKKLGFTNPYGAYVAKVFDNTAAAKAGLQPFDYIFGVDDQRTSDNQDLSAILEDYEPGQEVSLHFIRNGQTLTAKVTLGDADEQDSYASSDSPGAFLGVSPADEEDSDDMDGVTIGEVIEQSTAMELGLKEGDILTRLNGHPILDWEDLTTAIQNLKPGELVEVVYSRNGEVKTARQSIKSYSDVYPDEEDLESNYDNMTWNEPDDEEVQDQDSENRAFLGIYTEHISEEKARKLGFDNPFGTYVTGVLKNSAAEKAGIQPLDYIFGIDEYRVGENQWLSGILNKYKPGDNATIHFFRKGKKSSAKLTFGKPFEAKKTTRNDCEDPFFGILEEEIVQQGVRVNPVEGSTASDLGLQKGDVITAINGYKMVDWQDVTLAIEMLKPGETISVEYLRNDKSMKGSRAIRSLAETKKCENCDCKVRGFVIDDIDINPNIDIRMRSREKASEQGGQRTDVSKMTLTLEDASPTDLGGNLHNKGVHASSSNSLNIERLSVTPNTAKGMFRLEFNLPASGNTLVRLYNPSGRVIYEYELGNYSGSFSDDVDISQNGPGSYFLQVTQGDRSFTKKIVLAKS